MDIISDNKNLKSNRIAVILLGLLVTAFLAIGVRCFYLQWFRSDYYSSIYLVDRQIHQLQQPQRGVILDRRGSAIFAASDKEQIVFAEPRVIKDPESLSKELGEILGMAPEEIGKLIAESKNPGFVKIKADVDPNQCLAADKIYGIGVQSSWRRNYPVGPLACHVIGFTGADNIGLEGIELKYNQELAGSAGDNIFFADARPHRRPIRLKQQGKALTDGVGIILTIDAVIQQFAREELLKQFKIYEAESAVAIVAEPVSGAILAMVSLPDFDPKNRSTADTNSQRNRTLTDPFEPGSMIKPIVVAIALDNGVITKNEKIFCENGNYRGKSFGQINEYKNHQFGNLAVREILIKSSNIGMAKIGQKLGKEKLYENLTMFGFGKKTGIDLPGEHTGLLRPIEKWTGYSVTRIPYGYEMSTTAIQMVRAFCVLANGGRAVQPFLVRAVVGSDGNIVKQKRPGPSVGFIIKPEVAKWIVTNALVGVVNEKDNGGTGWRAKLEKWQVFGKTGTANIARIGQKGYEDNFNIASFIGGAPAEKPAIVVLVSIRRPNKKLGKGDSGGSVASPVVGRIIEKTLTYLEDR